MHKDLFKYILADLKERGYVEAIVTLDAIESCGGYSSAQCTMRFEVDKIECRDACIVFPAYKAREMYNPFACGKLISGGEPIYIPYSKIVCVVGVN